MKARETIVPGVHDRIPPQGRLRLELVHPDTGRVRHRVEAENLVSTAMLNIMNSVRGVAAPNSTAIPNGSATATNANRYGPNMIPFANVDSGVTRAGWADRWNRPGQFPGLYPSAAHFRTLWLSNSALAPNAARTHIPGTISAACVGDLAHTTAVNQRLGTIVPPSMILSHDKARCVAEWSTAQGNGTHRSIGWGSVIQNYQGDEVCAYPLNLVSIPNTHVSEEMTQNSTGDIEPAWALGSTSRQFSAAFVATGEIWTISPGDSLRRRDMSGTASAINTDGVVAVAGPTYTTIGAGATTVPIGVAVIGADLWLGVNKTLKRCVKPTDTTLTVTNNYDVTASFTDAAIRDITTDGVHIYAVGTTSIFKYLASTGAFVAAYPHGLTFVDVAGIEWDPACGWLWVTVGDDGGFYTASLATTGVAWNLFGSGAQYYQDLPSRAFSATGVALGHTLRLPGSGGLSGSSNNQSFAGPITGMSPDGQMGFWRSYSWTNNTQFVRPIGASLGSHALLGADVVKDSSVGMKLTYDLNFA